MTLEALRLKLVAAATSTDIAQVAIDYNSVLNDINKSYPLALWDFNNMEGRGFLVTGQEALVTINCWFLILVTPEDDIDDRHKQWDTLYADALAYLGNVDDQTSVTVLNIRQVPFENYPAGLTSLEREMAVRYSVELKLWC